MTLDDLGTEILMGIITTWWMLLVIVWILSDTLNAIERKLPGPAEDSK